MSRFPICCTSWPALDRGTGAAWSLGTVQVHGAVRDGDSSPPKRNQTWSSRATIWNIEPLAWSIYVCLFVLKKIEVVVIEMYTCIGISKQTRAVYSSRILLPQFVWAGACIVQSRWHTRALPALGRRRLVFVKGLIKKLGTSWYCILSIFIYGVLEVQLLSQFGDNIFVCWYKSTSTRADNAAADVATQCLYRLIVWG